VSDSHHSKGSPIVPPVKSNLDIQIGAVYRNTKNGRNYAVLGFVVSFTNGYMNGDILVRYRRVGGECEFVRHEIEFDRKFERVTINL
jgi:hypothetical protein